MTWNRFLLRYLCILPGVFQDNELFSFVYKKICPWNKCEKCTEHLYPTVNGFWNNQNCILGTGDETQYNDCKPTHLLKFDFVNLSLYIRKQKPFKSFLQTKRDSYLLLQLKHTHTHTHNTHTHTQWGGVGRYDWGIPLVLFMAYMNLEIQNIFFWIWSPQRCVLPLKFMK